MKKLIPFIIVLLGLGVVMAPEPCPFSGTVITIPEDACVGMKLQLTYGLNTYTTATDEFCNYQFDLGGSVLCKDGMQFEIKIQDCTDAVCKKTVTFEVPGVRNIDFDLAHVTIPTTIPATTTVEPCLTESECRELCDAWVVCPECPECVDVTIVVAITIVITAIVSIGGGIKIYKKRTGEAEYHHRHKGIRGYHSPNVTHKKKIYRHTLWRDNPLKCIQDVTKINKEGSL